MIAFTDDHRPVFGVEPICCVLPIAPSPHDEHAARWRNPARLPARVRRDAVRRTEIRRVWEETLRVCGGRKVWRQLRREGIAVARGTTARLMPQTGLSGAVRDSDEADSRHSRGAILSLSKGPRWGQIAPNRSADLVRKSARARGRVPRRAQRRVRGFFWPRRILS